MKAEKKSSKIHDPQLIAREFSFFTVVLEGIASRNVPNALKAQERLSVSG
jgi:hypothetical protein